MKKGKIKYAFPGGNTPRGFHSFYALGLQNMEKIFILKGGPGTGKSTLIRKIGLEMADRGYHVEFWQCSSDNDSLDGVIIPHLKTAVVDGTAPHVVDPKYPGAYQNLAKAKKVYDQWKSINGEAVDFNKVNQKTENLIQEIFSIHTPLVRHLFAGAISPDGIVNFISNITEDCKTRYILKGHPGTGKSFLIKKIVEGAVERGYQTDVYHCALDPDSIDMVVISQLGIAVLDGSMPHVEEPERPGDKIIDMLDCLDLEEVNKKSDHLTELQAEYHRWLNKAIAKIAEAKKLHDGLEVFYIKAMDFDAVNETRKQIFNKILALAATGKTEI